MDCQAMQTAPAQDKLQMTSSKSSVSNFDQSLRVETQTVEATHNAVKAEDLAVFLGKRCLLSNAELKVSESAFVDAGSKVSRKGSCYGLVGVNGCGKSTLLRVIGEGHIPIPSTWDTFLVNQHLPAPLEHTPVEEVLSANSERAVLVEELLLLEEAMKADTSNCEDCALEVRTARMVHLQNELSKWADAEKEVVEILMSLGFHRPEQHEGQCCVPTIETLMTKLSGGWRMKVQLAKALWLKPKLLLLDEPTNHLDFQASQWLQCKLEEYSHTVIVVSHDVTFLHQTCTEILWMKDLKLESLPRDTVSQDDLLRMQRRRSLKFNFATPADSNPADHGLSLHNVEFSYDTAKSKTSQRPYLLKVKNEIRFSGSSRSVMLGKNGSGKSTFLDLCAGKALPAQGTVDRTAELKVGHYSQFTDHLDNNSTETAASFLVRECREELALHAGTNRAERFGAAVAARAQQSTTASASRAKASTQEKRLLEIARGILSNFGFDGDVSATTPVDCLSGGQKALLKFAVLSLRPVHILLLDEPTNHLDAEACEALAKGLSEFKGGIVAVTHDELLIYRLIHCNWSASELLVCRRGSVSRERNFGAHCLQALKNDMHRAEDGEEQDSQLSTTLQSSMDEEKPVSSTSKKGLPPWLKSKSRRKSPREDRADVPAAHDVVLRVEDGEPVRRQSVPLQGIANDEKVVSNTKELPPWLKSKAQGKGKVRVATDVDVIRTDIRHESCAEDIRTSAAEVDNHEGRAVGKKDSKEKVRLEHIPQKRVESSSNANETSSAVIVGSWEDYVDSDAPTDVPEGRDEHNECGEAEHEGVVHESEQVQRIQQPSSQNEVLVCCVDETSANFIDHSLLFEAEPEAKGRHSRFRKDLLNLNKAVVKLLGKGTPHHEVSMFIKSSKAAERLQDLHGTRFDENDFAASVVDRASKKLNRSVAQ